MSVPNRGQLIAAAWEDYVKTDPQDQVFNFFWLLENLKTGNSFQKGSGDPITGTIEYNTNSTVKAMSELETLDINRVDVFDRYEYPWKFVGGDIVMSEFEKLVTAGGAGKFDLEAGKIDNLKKSMQQQMNADLFSDGTGTSGKQAGGLQLFVSSTPTSGSPGGINRAVYTFWRNQQTAARSRPRRSTTCAARCGRSTTCARRAWGCRRRSSPSPTARITRATSRS
jgi:hypothetical protein